jgi:hypothetical protein
MLTYLIGMPAGDGKVDAANDGKAKGKQDKQQAGWFAAKYKAARHAARGILNRTLRVSDWNNSSRVWNEAQRMSTFTHANNVCWVVSRGTAYACLALPLGSL